MGTYLLIYLLTYLFHGAEIWTVGEVSQKYLESFELWCWRRIEISWTDRVGSEEVLLRVNEWKLKEAQLDWSHLAWGLSSEIRYWRCDRSDGKTGKKTWAPTGWPWGKERILETERGSTRSHCLQNWLYKGLWNCRTADCTARMNLLAHWQSRSEHGYSCVSTSVACVGSVCGASKFSSYWQF